MTHQLLVSTYFVFSTQNLLSRKISKLKNSKKGLFSAKRGNIWLWSERALALASKILDLTFKKSPKCPKWGIYKTQFSNLVCSIRIFCLFSSLIKISHTYDSRYRTRSRTYYVTLCNVEWKKYDGVSLNCSLIDLKLARDWLRRFLKIFDRSDTNSVLMTLFDSASWITDSFSRINNAVELSS